MPTLVFIDTNIWLDFYRVHGRLADLSLLERIDENRDRIITSYQVEMEFKKNRPRVILEAHRGLKTPDLSSLQLPAFLAQSKQSKGLAAGRDRIAKQVKTLRERTERVFTKPTVHDPVYKVAQRVFRERSPYNLDREHGARDTVRRLAYKRFVLGYPPRKPGDTAVGDSVNWEWIVRCARESSSDVVIVSRDSDYGVTLDGDAYANDWLQQEFKERVSRKRNVTLTHRLSDALRRASVAVSSDEEAAETEFLKERTASAPLSRDQALATLLHLASQNDLSTSGPSILSSWVRLPPRGVFHAPGLLGWGGDELPSPPASEGEAPDDE